MLFDVFFFGFPIALVICLAAHGLREQDARYWRVAFCLGTYCIFYLGGGREVILYLLCAAMIGGGWLFSGGTAPAI